MQANFWHGRLALCSRSRAPTATQAAKGKLARFKDEEGRTRKSKRQGTMVRCILLVTLAVLLAVGCADVAVQNGGGIRGSASIKSLGADNSSGISSSLASAASTLLKVWPHPAAHVLHHAANAVRRNLQGDLQSAGEDLGVVCSSDNLGSNAGIAACTEACAPAQCCQTGNFGDGCGVLACSSYAPCLNLGDIVGVDEGEMDMTTGDDSGTNTTDTGPTGDGTFNDPEEGSLMDKLSDMGDAVKDTFKKATTDPSSLSTGEMVGLAIGCFVIFMILVCLIKCCCKKKAA